VQQKKQAKEEETKSTEKLIEKPVDKFASKTFYGGNPMEMAKKMDEENARRMKSELTDRTGDLDNIEEKPDSEEVNPKKAFGKGVTDQTTSGKVMPSTNFSNPFGGAPKPGISGGQGNPTLTPAAFGQSSLGQATMTQDVSKQPKSTSNQGRTFGSINPTSGGSGFKSLIGSNQPQTNTFLASGADKVEDNDMAADEDIFGEGTSQPVNTGFGNPTGFGQPQNTGFGQMSGGSNTQGSLGFNPKNPSFTQRRK